MLMNTNFRENGRQFFSGLSTKIWLESELIRSWTVADAELFADILRSPDMELPGMGSVIAHIENRTGQRFENLHTASRLIPVMMEGAEHATLRRALAVYLSAKTLQAEHQLPNLVKDTLKPFQIRSRFDVYHDVVRPLIHQFISQLVGKAVTQDLIDLRLDLILLANKSPVHLRDLDRRFGVAIDFLKSDCLDEIELACKICCITFGSETLCMMLVESMLSAIDASSLLKTAKLPIFPVETGVPQTWRRVTKDTAIAGQNLRAGDIVKLQLQAAGYANRPPLNNLIFGAGVHSCIGKQVTLALWEKFSTAFNDLRIHGRVGKYVAMIEPHMIRYEKAEIEIL